VRCRGTFATAAMLICCPGGVAMGFALLGVISPAMEVSAS
jgi:hypothetical protein